MLEPSTEFYLEVEVKNPIVEDGSYVSYEIAIETNNHAFSKARSATRRRYSDFVHLRKMLVKEFPAWKLPPLPPKFPFKDHFQPTFIEKRRKGLEEFVVKLVSQKIFLSSKALHLFLQSSHPLSEIFEIIHKDSSPVQLNNSIFTNESYPNSIHASLADDISTLSLSSHTEVDPTVNSFPTQSSIIHSKTDSHSSAESKRVSFCDEVTVAQISVE